MKKRYVVAGILAAAGLICGGIAYYQYYQDAHAGQEYEKIKEIGENYIPIFWQNFKNIVITFAFNFLIVFGVMYITTSRVKEGLKSFFADEKKEISNIISKYWFIYYKLSAIKT